jgi:hypothetical protein
MTADEYRKYARECFECAEAGIDEDRKSFLALAMDWMFAAMATERAAGNQASPENEKVPDATIGALKEADRSHSLLPAKGFICLEGATMQTLDREWHRAVKRGVLAHVNLAKSMKPADRKLAQAECDAALAEYQIAHGKLVDRAVDSSLDFMR